ncbi:MAG: DUF5666 domain-containing protein [Steroidobacteraceae bacterium]
MNDEQGLRHALRGALLAAGATALAACGGGAMTAGIDGGGIQPAAVTVGGITGFGSVFVNGVEYQTGNSTTYTINGQSGTESQLRVGQVVRITGRIDDNGTTGSATSISFDDNVEGPITALDTAAGTLTVMGQAVRVTATTIFDDASISPADITGLASGQVVEVSGFPDAGGVIVASRIEGKAAGGELEVSGQVSALTATTFGISGLTVDYASVTVQDGTLANGGCAEVKGTRFDAASSTLTATRVQVKSCGVAGQKDAKGELEGVVTTLDSASGSTLDFTIGPQRVLTNASTRFDNGTAADVQANVKLEVEGRFDASGALVATRVKIEPESSLRVAGIVQGVDAAARTLSVLGVTVHVDAMTRLEDKRSKVSGFSLASIVAGDYVEARGYAPAGSAAGSFSATLLERDQADNRQRVRGPLPAAPTAQNLSVLGVPVGADGSTEFRARDGSSIASLDAFIGAAVAAGGLVEARCRDDRGQCTPSFVAEQLEIQQP